MDHGARYHPPKGTAGLSLALDAARVARPVLTGACRASNPSLVEGQSPTLYRIPFANRKFGDRDIPSSFLSHEQAKGRNGQSGCASPKQIPPRWSGLVEGSDATIRASPFNVLAGRGSLLPAREDRAPARRSADIDTDVEERSTG